jgi:hypothetical protein
MTESERARPTRRTEDDPDDPDGHDDPSPPYALVRNGDETARTVSISIGRSDGRATGEEYRLAEDHERAVTLGAPLGGVCRIDVDAESGASARIALDPARVGPAPVARFLLRGDRIAVSGVSFPPDGRNGLDRTRRN